MSSIASYALTPGRATTARSLWRRLRTNYAYLYRVTRADFACSALLLPWSASYRELRKLRNFPLTVVDRSAERPPEDYGHDIVLTKVEARITVNEAPERSRMTLRALQDSDPRLMFVGSDWVQIGQTHDGHLVSYRVVGWDPGNWEGRAPALLLERIAP